MLPDLTMTAKGNIFACLVHENQECVIDLSEICAIWIPIPWSSFITAAATAVCSIRLLSLRDAEPSFIPGRSPCPGTSPSVCTGLHAFRVRSLPFPHTHGCGFRSAGDALGLFGPLSRISEREERDRDDWQFVRLSASQHAYQSCSKRS